MLHYYFKRISFNFIKKLFNKSWSVCTIPSSVMFKSNKINNFEGLSYLSTFILIKMMVFSNFFIFYFFGKSNSLMFMKLITNLLADEHET